MPNDLKLQQGQRMVLTPQLQQAIEVLGLSSAELLDEIHRVSDDNPFLEVTEPQAQEEHASPVQEPVRKPDAREIQSSDDAGGNPEGDFSAAHDSFGELNFPRPPGDTATQTATPPRLTGWKHPRHCRNTWKHRFPSSEQPLR